MAYKKPKFDSATRQEKPAEQKCVKLIISQIQRNHTTYHLGVQIERSGKVEVGEIWSPSGSYVNPIL